jgi:transposase-like protein
MGRDTIPPEVKAAAMAELLDGEQPAIVAERYDLNAATVRSWKARLDLPATADATAMRGVATGVAIRQPAIEAQQLAIGELVMASLRAKIFATQKIAEYVTTEAWLDKQNAADVATLFETIDRAAVGILDRMAQRSHGDGDADPDGTAPDATP